jgi:hypothetical protein
MCYSGVTVIYSDWILSAQVDEEVGIFKPLAGLRESAGSGRELYFLRTLPLREVAVFWPVLASDPVAMLGHGNE